MLVMLSPLLRQQFNNNGSPMANGLLFSYAAGTMNKATTYKDFLGTVPNTNPIVLDQNGSCDLWVDESQTYKFILSPAGDTDPPTNPIWTRDNINSSYGGALQTYNAAYAAAIGGYPSGTILQSANGQGLWMNVVAGNTTNPDTGGAGWIVAAQKSATFAQISALTSDIGPIICSDMGGKLYTWQTSAYFTGYRSVCTGEIPTTFLANPLPWMESMIGGTWSTADPKQARLIAWFQEQGLTIAQASWTPGMGMIASLGSGNWQAPDARNMFWRVAGTDLDTANPRNIGTLQLDAFRSHMHPLLTSGVTTDGTLGARGSSQTSLTSSSSYTGSTGGSETRGINTAVASVILV